MDGGVELPTVAAELERKTLDQLERLVRFHEQGKITKAQFATGLETVFQIVSGLVPEAIILAIENSDLAPDDGSFESRQVFWKHRTGEVIVVTRHTQGRKLSVKRLVPNDRIPKIAQYSFENETIPSKVAKDKQQKLAAGLISGSFQEI